MAEIARKTKRYPSDLTDEEWERMAPLMPAPGRRGRPREVEFREVINAVPYLVRSGCGWRMLPIHFGHWRTVYGWFRELARRFLFQTIHDVELMLDRERAGREASPTAGVIDSQSVKAPQAETTGYDALPRRWVVERTFGWMTRWRRLVRDYERRIDVSKAMILVAMGGNLVRRNAHP